MKDNQLNVTIFGAGSIGCYLGGQLASAGMKVRLIGRERFKAAIEENGLTLTHYARNSLFISENLTFDLDASDASDADIVLITVKSQDSETAGRELANILDKEAIIISFQNGIGNADALRSVMPDHRVLGGMVPFNVTGTGAGRFHCGTEGNLAVEAMDSDALRALQAAFEQVGQGCDLKEDIKAVQWGKLLVNLNNALNTLAGVPLKTCLAERDYRTALASMIDEALGILKVAGITPANFGKNSIDKTLKVLRLPNWLYRLIMNSIVKIDANARSSMLDDLEAGRAPEVDYLQGEVVKLALQVGESAPISETVMALVKDAFEKGKSPKLSGAEILKAITS
ncbi:2-dehydropantoate 2-reductase [Kordiimonas sp. SCSIO 12610]|uniref:2-dehydropantoate 2-reductase n=1 Tax=Kordiimonas sp. SCSIO 12610 TaxID=2829597 RepID=UPI00210D2E5E|nr:2-dehydropantoate 2-reductase [Kordiimonas sp. SCSIO 12610]UTW56091.1 2-dehydropantoate 2-reductase [Kordiimonas sp. SCSIO 12610]